MYLGFNKRYITTKYYRMRIGGLENFRYNAFIKLRAQIKYLLGSFVTEVLIRAFITYENYMKTFKDYRMSELRSKQFHPFIRTDYFEVIDTKEKAYWLGVMYSDGSIIQGTNKTRNNKTSRRIKLLQNQKDKILVYRFTRTLGLNFKQIYYSAKWNSFEIQFRNHKIADDLIKQGVLHRKSKIIQLPKLTQIELYLAFLLGYFDGDGEAGSSRIFSGSEIFLKQIKQKFKIKNKIQKDQRENREGVKLYCYALNLGAVLFNEMLNNYKRSLKRKRKWMIIDLKEFHKTKFIKRVKELPFMRENLKDLLWEKPKYRVQEILNISYYMLNKLITFWKIEIPPSGYFIS